MREVFCDGPLPPNSGDYFCTMCAIRYKLEALELPDIKEKVTELEKEDGPPVRFDLLRHVKGRVKSPEMAVTVGMHPQLGMVPLCWGHLVPIKFTNIAAAAQGPGGAVVPLLGRH
jgi:hypothetical protein